MAVIIFPLKTPDVETATGTFRFVLVPSPSWPYSFRPNENTCPFAVWDVKMENKHLKMESRFQTKSISIIQINQWKTAHSHMTKQVNEHNDQKRQ